MPKNIPEFYIRPPQGKKSGFRIVKRFRAAPGEQSKSETVVSEAVDAINTQFLSGGMPVDQVREALERELARLRFLAAGGKTVTLSSANLRELKKYWTSEYEHRPNKDQTSAYNRLKRAVEALGDTPLTATKSELQRAVNIHCQGKPNKQRDIVGALNQILKFMGRTNCKLTRHKKSRQPVKYLSIEDFLQIVPFLPENLKLPAITAFATGCRTGEVMYLNPNSLRMGGTVLFVEFQLTEDLEPDETKNKQARDVPIIPEFKPQVEQWLKVTDDSKRELRNLRHADKVKAACKKIWKTDKSKWLRFHDLRHSYAIHLLNKGTSLEMVAQALGDSITVAQEHYTGFVLTKPGIDSVITILNATNKKPKRKKTA